MKLRCLASAATITVPQQSIIQCWTPVTGLKVCVDQPGEIWPRDLRKCSLQSKGPHRFKVEMSTLTVSLADGRSSASASPAAREGEKCRHAARGEVPPRSEGRRAAAR